MTEKTIKVWVTKYALTRGVYRVDARRCSDKRYLWCPKVATSLRIGKNCFEDLDEAKWWASLMARGRIASLEKQIEKLRELEREPRVEVES